MVLRNTRTKNFIWDLGEELSLVLISSNFGCPPSLAVIIRVALELPTPTLDQIDTDQKGKLRTDRKL